MADESFTDLLSQLVTALAKKASIDITIHIPGATERSNNHPSGSPRDQNEEPKHDLTESYEQLKNYGIQGDERLLELSAHHSPERIRECIEHIDANHAVKNKPAYLVKALACNYYKTRRKR